MIKHPNSYPSMARRVDSIRMSWSERQVVKKQIRDTERVADLIWLACEELRSVENFLRGMFAHRA
jgi:hypothetical protein